MDHLGSPRISTNALGQTIARHDYQPFGEEIARSSYGADENRKQFATYERDRETDLDYAQARTYNKNLGRFNSTDPIQISKEHPANPQRWNLFIYVINNPLVLNDPDGKKPKRVIDVFLTFDTSKEDRAAWDKIRKEAKKNGVKINIYRSDNGTSSAEKFIQSIMTKGRSVVVAGHSHGTAESVAKGVTTGRFYGMGVEFGGKSVLSNRSYLSGDNPEATDTVDGLNARAKNIAVFTCDFGGTFDSLGSENKKTNFLRVNNGKDGESGLSTINNAALAVTQVMIIGGSGEQMQSAAQKVFDNSSQPRFDSDDTVELRKLDLIPSNEP